MLTIWLVWWCFLCFYNFLWVYLAGAKESSFSVVTFEFDQFRYKIVGESSTFFEADRFCDERYFSDLVKIYSKAVQDEIVNQAERARLNGEIFVIDIMLLYCLHTLSIIN